MPVISHCLIVVGVWSSLILAGYWLVVRLDALSPAERLATAILAGLSLFIWNASIWGFVFPFSGSGVWVCLWPIAATVLIKRARISLWSDFRAIIGNRKGRIAIFSMALITLALLWPLFARPHLIFFDGTSNHDAFFWISGAEFLRDHTYMGEPIKSTVQPLTNGVGVFTGGWTPMWGRMSAEGLLALISTISGLATIQIYVATTIALFLPWVAAVYLAAKTFLIREFSLGALVVLGATQPLFVFFQANSNLPNLLGCLNAALLVIATARSVGRRPGFAKWNAVTAISMHGMLCSYPEMAPFILVTIGLLWSRTLFSKNPRQQSRNAILAGLAGLALNPATTVRAFSGFYRSFHAASVDAIWPKLFENLSLTERPLALATLTLHTVDDAGVWVAAFCSAGLIAATVVVLRSAADRFGATTTLIGPALLFTYTLISNFSYGWQKVAQFGGVFVAAIIPVAAVNLAATTPVKRRLAPARHVIVAGLTLFFVYATARNVYESHKWARRKFIHDDWLKIREYSHQHLRNATVRIDAPSFAAPYFYGMWSLYALADSHPLFSKRESDNGGYVHDYTRNEKNYPDEVPAAYFVGARWAETFDANSPRLLAGQTAALLSKANRVELLDGFLPTSGVPEFASSHLLIGLKPHSMGKLQFTLTPRVVSALNRATWHVLITSGESPVQHVELSGTPPWHFSFPLVPLELNQIEITRAGQDDIASFPYTVSNIAVTNDAGK